MKRRGIAAFGVFILLAQLIIVAFGSSFESPSRVVSYALTTVGGGLLVLAGFDVDRFGSSVRWNHFTGTGLALSGLGLAVSGLLSAGVGTESIDRIAVVGQVVGAVIVVWFGWQIAFDTRHVNFDWMNDTSDTN